jgi:RNase adaptor protein for sRNA GlmZ degradation
MKLISFGYKYGANKDTDININIRHVPNPSSKMRKNLTGLDKRFRKDFLKDRKVQEHYQKILDTIREYLKTNPDHLIGIGCHLGRHRSVAFVEQLKEDLSIEIEHRDIY